MGMRFQGTKSLNGRLSLDALELMFWHPEGKVYSRKNRKYDFMG
jgi:hypothetical protein